MTIAYRSDTGTLKAAGTTAAQTISFVSTQPSAGDLVVQGGGIYVPSSQTPTVGDNQSNTYTLAVMRDINGNTSFPSSNSHTAVYYVENCASTGTFTISVDGNSAGDYITWGGVAFSGAATSDSLDVTQSNYAQATDTTSFSTNSTATTAQDDSVAIAALVCGTGNNINTITASGYTVPATEGDGTVYVAGAFAYKILSATGTQSCTFSYGATSGSTTHAAAIAVFKGAAGATQTGSPSSDVSGGSWTYSTGSTYYGTVDEAVADNADYDYSSTNSDTLKLGGYGLTDPGVDTGFQIKYRVSATGSDGMTLYLYEGTTLRATDTTRTPGTTPTDYTWDVPAASVANIGNWANIQTWLTTGTHGGASSTSAMFPTSTSTASESGHSNNNWTSISNITADDTSYASITSSTYDTNDESYVIYAQGFDFSAIPSGSTIDGVECVVHAWYTAGSASGSLAQLLDTSGTRGGTDQWSGLQAFTGSEADYTIGGASDKWGNSLTESWVKNANFGVALGVQATGNNTDVFIDFVTLKVYYTPPAADWRLQWIQISAPAASTPHRPLLPMSVLRAVPRASTW